MSTDILLPPTHTTYIDTEFVITKKQTMATCIYDEDSESRLRALQETGRNNLLLAEMVIVLEKLGFIVAGNKSAMVPGRRVQPVSLCSSTQPDMLAFNPHTSTALYVETEPAPEDTMGDDTVALVTENKDEEDNDASSQQLIGGIEKALGELGLSHLQHHGDDKAFQYVQVFALSITHRSGHHQSGLSTVRRVDVDFVNGASTIHRGITQLVTDIALNRIVAKILP